MKKLAMASALLALLIVSATGVWANAIPTQITLSSSSVGNVVFTNSGGNLSFSFTGTTAQCGHANCVSGNALLESQAYLGKYTMWMTGTPTLSGPSSDYSVGMSGVNIWLSVSLNSPFSDTLTTRLTPTDLFGATGRAPSFDGTFVNLSSSGPYLGTAFPSGSGGDVDFTVRSSGGTTVSTLGNNHSLSTFVSSGELVPSPEPSTLALLGTSILGVAGVIRRKK